jgi:hypothetical protein
MKQTIELHKKWKADPSKGEVFTPSELVREMLDKIPSDVWENPESKFLDPCMGKGTFIVEIVKRLIDIYGYSKEDAISRVYGYDTCVKYVNHLKRGGLVNVFHKDFLNEEIIMKFDVVIGNPPYQENSSKGKSKGGGRGGDKNLYSKFIKKSDELLKQDGFLMFLTPPAIFSPKNKNKEVIFNPNNNLVLVKIFDENPFPNVSTNVCYFMMKKTLKTTTKFLTNNGEIELNLSEADILPSVFNQNTISIFSKLFNSQFEKFNFERDCSLHSQNTELFSNEQDENFQYPVYNGSKIKYTSIIPQNMGVEKIVVSRSGYYKPIVDNGSIGTTETNFFIRSNNLNGLFNILNHPLYKFVVEKSKFNGFIHQQVLKSLPNPGTSENLFEIFNITESEVQYILNNVR